MTRTQAFPEIFHLSQLIQNIIDGKVRVPKFQRPFVWTQQDVLTLLDSVYSGFPIGSILIWETHEDVESVSTVGPIRISNQPTGITGYLLDGQQRITSLVGTLKIGKSYQSAPDQIDWRIYFDLEKLEFVRCPRRGLSLHHFPIACLFDTSQFLEAASKIRSISDNDKSRKLLREADHLADAFRDYKLPIIRIQDADLDGAVTVFARLNRTGRKISADEMVSALTYRRGEFHLAQSFDIFINELASKGFHSIKRVLLLRSVLAALNKDIYAKDWAKLMVDEEIRSRLPESFESATQGVFRAINFLKGLGVTSDRLLPYGLQLVLLGEFYRLCPTPPSKIDLLLKRWFWVTSFTGWFGIISTSKITHALIEMRKLAKGEINGFTVMNLNEEAAPFPKHFDSRSARSRTFLLYLASLKPLSLYDESEIEVDQLLSEFGANGIGYVRKDPSTSNEYSSIPANRMFIGGDDPNGGAFELLRNLGNQVLEKLLPSHGFPPESIEVLKCGKADKFIEMRQENLIQGERIFMGERNVALPQKFTAHSIADSEVSDIDD